MFAINLLFAAITIAVVASSSDYKAYLLKYGKDLSRLNEPDRIAAFQDSVKLVDEHNSQTKSLFKMGLNKFSDWKVKELLKAIKPGPNSAHDHDVNDDIPVDDDLLIDDDTPIDDITDDGSIRFKGIVLYN
jgi:hypothetical protein